MIINFNAAGTSTAPAAPAANTNLLAALAPAPASPAPGAAPPPASAVVQPLFARVLGLATANSQDSGAPAAGADVTPGATPGASSDKAADEHKPDDKADAVPADIAVAAPPVEHILPAMVATVSSLLVPFQAPAPAQATNTAPAQATDATVQTQAQANMAQSNPALVLNVRPEAVTLNASAVPLNASAVPPGRDTREPLAAANPLPAGKGGAPGMLFDTLLNRAPAAIVAPPATSVAQPGDSERTPAPVASTQNPGLTAAVANGAPAMPGNDTVKLAGTPQQWQAPLREALGERLQTQIGANSEMATIRLDPPMLGRIDISIRHMAGTLQVSVSASNTEVLRQLQGISENLRNDLAQRQFTDVAVNISATPRSPAAQAFAEGDARGQRQPGRQQDDAEPGRALSDDAPTSSTFAMYQREQHG